MVNFLLGVDEQILFLFNGYHTSFLDSAFMMITHKYTWVPLYLFLTVILFRKCGVKVALCMLLGIALAVTLSDQACATYIRPLADRLRPSNLENPISQYIQIVDGYRGGRYGFPSCHAANTFALATLFSLIMSNRKWSIAIVSWALVVCSSRMYLGVHYPSDIIAGALVGSFMGWMCYMLVVKIITYKRFRYVFAIKA